MFLHDPKKEKNKKFFPFFIYNKKNGWWWGLLVEVYRKKSIETIETSRNWKLIETRNSWKLVETSWKLGNSSKLVETNSWKLVRKVMETRFHGNLWKLKKSDGN